MIWPALVMAAAGAGPSGALPVRLAPVTCPGFPDAHVRAALRVEIRDRLVTETAPAPSDFALVSVACAGDDAELLIVHQGSGDAVRRRVPLATVVPDARPRAVAIAIAELLRVDLARNDRPPQAATPAPAPPPFAVAISGTPLVLGRYFSGAKRYWFGGIQLRVAFERAIEPPPGRAWGWGLALALDDSGPGGVDRFAIAGAASALIRRRGAVFTWELGLGARFGRAWDYLLDASPPAANIYGPFGWVALESQRYERAFSRLAVEAGADAGPLGGGWARLLVSGGLRF